MNIAVIAALGAMLLWGAADFFIQKLCRKIGNLNTLLVVDIAAAIILLPFAIGDIGKITAQDLPLLAVVALNGWLTGITSFEALQKGKLAVIDAILVLELPFTIVLGIFFFADTISADQWLLIGTIILGTALVSLEKLKTKEL